MDCRTILLVEDQELVRRVVARHLRRNGFLVIEAANAFEARERFQDLQLVDLLLIDLILPGRNGPSLVRDLCMIQPDLKVLYLSAYPEEIMEAHGLLQTGMTFLENPQLLENLNVKVRRILDRKAPAAGLS